MNCPSRGKIIGNVALTIILLLIVLCFPSVATDAANSFEERANLQVKSNLHVVQMALEMYAVDHQRSYPLPASLLRALRPQYLVDGHFPRNPFASHSRSLYQRNVILVDRRSGLLPAGRIQTSPGKTIGKGKFPRNGFFDIHTYGAIAYDLDPQRNIYVLYGIGKKKGQAILVATVSNFRK